MFDFKFDWDKQMETHIEIIDSQHKELFKIARNLEQLIMTKCIGVSNRKLYDIVSELRNYISYHFYHEEKLMEEYNYSKYEQHKKEHDAFQKNIMKIDCTRLVFDSNTVLIELKNYIQDWVFNHILIEDFKMAAELKPFIKK